MKRRLLSLILITAIFGVCREKKERPPSPIDKMIAESQANSQAQAPSGPTSGSIWAAGNAMTDLGSDLRARRVYDALTILVVDRASAVAKGATKSSRASNANSSVGSLMGPLSATGALPNLLNLNSNRDLQGQGETSRETTLETTLSARVTHVLPNGDLVVHGVKTVRINSEAQTIEVRGIVRQFDISPGNTVLSDQLSFLEVAVDGKGVIDDAVKRPNFLYRLVLGLLPF